MKLYVAAAGALLLGTSALAFAPDAHIKTFDVSKPIAADADAKAKPAMAAGSNTKPEQMAWADSTLKVEPASWARELKPKPAEAWNNEPSSVAHADIAYGAWRNDDVALAKADFEDEPGAVPSDPGSDLAESEPLSDDLAIGGPIEDGAVTTDALQPRPANRNYPPCDPGPGDDNCIQLYEPGVRLALVAWNAPTGGLIDNSATTAMGGPFEPVADDAIETAEAAPVHQGDLTGIGGPTRETGYPPCSGSPEDDRCIQLYEPGVTGAGN